MRYFLTPSDAELANSQNITIKAMRTDDWFKSVPEEEVDTFAFFRDAATGGRATKLNEKTYIREGDHARKDKHEKEGRHPEEKVKQENEASHFDEHVRALFGPAGAMLLKQHYHQLLAGALKEMACGAFAEGILATSNTDYINNIYMDGQVVFCESTLLKLEVAKPLAEASLIAGQISFIYELNSTGFKLHSVAASNSILLDLCLSDNFISSHQLAEFKDFSQAEESLHSTIEKMQGRNSSVANRARIVLDETVRLRREGIADVKELTQVLLDTNEVIKPTASPEIINDYVQLAKSKTGHRSWAKILSGAMLSLAGAVIVVGSVMIAVATFGVSSPLSAVGIKVGASILAKGLSISSGALGLAMIGSGVTLARHGRAKSLSKKMYALNKTVIFWQRPGKAATAEFRDTDIEGVENTGSKSEKVSLLSK